MSMIDNLDYLKVFYYVARLGSGTRAAGELSISQPAVSQSLKQLERTLGVGCVVTDERAVHSTAARRLLSIMEEEK